MNPSNAFGRDLEEQPHAATDVSKVRKQADLRWREESGKGVEKLYSNDYDICLAKVEVGRKMTREISGISTSTTKEPKKADGEGDKKLEDQDRIVLMKCGTIDRGEDTNGRRTKNLEGGDIR